MDTTKSSDARTSPFWSAAMTCAHENGIRPQLNISGERGLEKQGINGMDLPGAKLDDAEDSKSFEDSEMEDRSESGNEDQVDHEAMDDAEETETDDKDDVINSEVYEEALVKLQRNPADPTPEGRAKHDMCHLPFRAWCPICVEARATEDPHYRSTA